MFDVITFIMQIHLGAKYLRYAMKELFRMNMRFFVNNTTSAQLFLEFPARFVMSSVGLLGRQRVFCRIAFPSLANIED